MKEEEYDRMLALDKTFFWFVGLYELVAFYVSRLSEGNSLEILDAGCGIGGLIDVLQKYGNVHGIDISEKAVSLCRKRGLRGVERIDLNVWDPPDGEFDVVTCLDVLYHKGVADEAQILRKIHRALKPAGHLIVNLPAFNFLRRAHDEHVETARRYTRTSFVEKAHDAGFRVEYATYRLPALFWGILLRIGFDRLTGRSRTTSELEGLPPRLNRCLLAMHRVENYLITKGVRLPFGSSLFVVAVKA